MGSWNQTCGVSNLSILFGEPIRIFIIQGRNGYLAAPYRASDWKEAPEIAEGDGPEAVDTRDKANHWRNGWWSGYVYGNDIFCPVSVAIKGTYEDYGEANVEDSLGARAAHTYIKERLLEFPAGKSNIPPKVSKEDSFHDLLVKMSEHAISVKADYNKADIPDSAPLGLWYVKESVYQTILGLSSHTWAGTINRNYFHACKDKYLDSLRAILGLPQAKMDYLDAQAHMFYQAFGGVDRRGAVRPMGKFLLQQHKEGNLNVNSEEVAELLSELADFCQFSFMLSCLRKGWMPQPGCGSQAINTKEHIDYLEAMLKVAKEMQATIDAERELYDH